MPCTIAPETIEKTIEFHGHSCPGLAIGIRAAELALTRLGHASDIDLVTVSETDMCGVDAIQFLTGCTFGKGNFLHRDWGKMAFSFFDRTNGKGFRITLKPAASGEKYPEMRSLMQKSAQGTASKEDMRRMKELRTTVQKRYMELELEEMFDIRELAGGAPRPARILESLTCEACGEAVMESRTRRFGGRTLCIPCFQKEEQKI